MKELLRYIIERVVSHPEEVHIEEEGQEGGFVQLRLRVHPEDMGIVIGRGGNIIRALRNVLRIKAIKENKRINLELIETEPVTAKPNPEDEA